MEVFCCEARLPLRLRPSPWHRQLGSGSRVLPRRPPGSPGPSRSSVCFDFRPTGRLRSALCSCPEAPATGGRSGAADRTWLSPWCWSRFAQNKFRDRRAVLGPCCPSVEEQQPHFISFIQRLFPKDLVWPGSLPGAGDAARGVYSWDEQTSNR